MSADDRAAAVAALDAATGITPAEVSASTVRPGWTLWHHGDAWVHLPTLRRDAPADVLARYWLRIESGFTGTCRFCDQVAEISLDPEVTPVAWWRLPVTIRLDHDRHCITRFTGTEHRWFIDPEAWKDTP
ncbi:hypothetical protein [Agromyces salentinus]|uniref:Uncharacterized protein n=1 Tax=Agromyces salentinus TaxID=269421 RepID=A0ABP4Z219_9MICO|nr:hypothetical protein [Agromyces salentinus]